MKELSKIRLRRAQQIYEVLSSAGGAGLTSKEVARAIGLKMSPYVWDLLAAGVERGWWLCVERDIEVSSAGFRMVKLYFHPDAAQDLQAASETALGL